MKTIMYCQKCDKRRAVVFSVICLGKGKDKIKCGKCDKILWIKAE